MGCWGEILGVAQARRINDAGGDALGWCSGVLCIIGHCGAAERVALSGLGFSRLADLRFCREHVLLCLLCDYLGSLCRPLTEVSAWDGVAWLT